jgi:hypothetical protein
VLGLHLASIGVFKETKDGPVVGLEDADEDKDGLTGRKDRLNCVRRHKPPAEENAARGHGQVVAGHGVRGGNGLIAALAVIAEVAGIGVGIELLAPDAAAATTAIKSAATATATTTTFIAAAAASSTTTTAATIVKSTVAPATIVKSSAIAVAVAVATITAAALAESTAPAASAPATALIGLSKRLARRDMRE